MNYIREGPASNLRRFIYFSTVGIATDYGVDGGVFEDRVPEGASFYLISTSSS
jgi:hypothetical protein